MHAPGRRQPQTNHHNAPLAPALHADPLHQPLRPRQRSAAVLRCWREPRHRHMSLVLRAGDLVHVDGCRMALYETRPGRWFVGPLLAEVRRGNRYGVRGPRVRERGRCGGRSGYRLRGRVPGTVAWSAGHGGHHVPHLPREAATRARRSETGHGFSSSGGVPEPRTAGASGPVARGPFGRLRVGPTRQDPSTSSGGDRLSEPTPQARLTWCAS